MDINSIRYDGSFDIATGRSRKEVHWHNREMQWSDFLKKISSTHRTAETYAEYMAEKKSRQDEIKDVGGFVGGYVNNGRRRSNNIIHRQLITLDVDFSSGAIWEDFTLLYDNAAAIYSTHKHTPAHPRLRLIMPLDRPVTREEYIAIARRVAGNLDINVFDDTTFEPSRLMYWPSTSKDGEFIFRYQDGKWLCADKILRSYRNWQDASEWPVSNRAGEVISREIKKQGDPLEKPGIVGAFCRTYGIREAIDTFLGNVYAACDMENRYTYLEGSTAAGLVIYDDKYAYSHHGTDPASGKLCNAFDLVRLHLFGLKDEDTAEGVPGHKLPSYLAMADFATKDVRVRKRLTSEKAREAKEDFAGEDTNKNETDWFGLLEVDRRGNIQPTANNLLIILENDPSLCGISYNEFRNSKDVRAPLPWRKKNDLSQWRDSDGANLYLYMEKKYGIANEANLKRAFKSILEKRKYNPVRDYLSSLKWDGVGRVESVFIDYLGAEDNEYTRIVTRKSLVAAVARIFTPGVKWDYALILCGPQGIGKSVMLQKLGRIDKGWFSDNFYLRGTKEDIEQLFGNWIIEMGELAGLSKRDTNEIKSYISRREDQCRLAYSEEKSFFPRQCVFFGTTNNDEFLRDTTGNRRFWPLSVGRGVTAKDVFRELETNEIDQIWAEAVELFKKGEKLFLNKATEAKAKKVQEDYCEQDDRAGIVREYLERPLPEDWDEKDLYERRNYLNDRLSERGTTLRSKVCIAEIWCECFGKDKADLDRRKSNEIAYIISSIGGWEKLNIGGGVTCFSLYGRQKTFVKKDVGVHQNEDLRKF